MGYGNRFEMISCRIRNGADDFLEGQCLKAFSNGKIPHVIRFHPDEDKQHIFLAGMSDKKIIQVRVPNPSFDSFCQVGS